MLDWSEPITTLQPVWAQEVIPHFYYLIALTEPIRGDALAAPLWAEVYALIDDLPPPPTVEEANSRWREVVGLCWRMVGQALRRRRCLPG